MSKKKINIGLDIGVSSVGWSIIDEDQNIIDLGVRLFNDVAESNDGSLLNEKRRSSRTMRRRLNRIKTRKNAFKKYMLENSQFLCDGWKIDENDYKKLINIDITKFGVNNPVELKVKALNEKISKEELFYILFHYIHHRGFFYLTEEDLTDEVLNENKSLQFPSIKIYEFYKNNGWYKGFEDSNNFSAEKYKLEIEEVFKKQEINNKEFIKGYMDIFSSVRDFATGPGSEKSPTPYGMYYKDKDGSIKKREGENLWDATIGKCTYYPDEKRGGKNSPIAEVFNLVNDINNIRFFKSSDPRNKLDKNIKDKIYEAYSEGFVGKAFNLKPNKLIKIGEKLNWFKERFSKDTITENDINGYRVDTKNNPIITELKNYSAIIEYLLKNEIIKKENVCIFNINLLSQANKIFEELSKYQDAQKRINVLRENYPNSKDEDNISLIKKLKGLSTTHSLSYKAMKEFIEYALNNLDSNDNQMQYFENTINKNKDNEEEKYGKYLPKNKYENEIISPTTKRAFNQTINVINSILKKKLKDYEIDNITIELARDKNTFEEAKNIRKQQTENEKKIKEICSQLGLDPENLNATKKLRLKLWAEQDHKDLYDGKYIELNEVLMGTNLDIDHIIPFSISNDDSINNKVLTKSSNNKEKGNLTPYLWLGRKGLYEEYKNRVKSTIKGKNKLENLLFEEPDLESDLHSFIQRNLVDTRYSSRIVLNLAKDFFNKNQDKYGHVKVKVIRGKMTNFARYNLFVDQNNKSLLPKDRDIYCHHAIDAAIVCWLGMNHSMQRMLDYSERVKKDIKNKYDIDEQNRIIDPETGEVISEFKINRNEETEKFGKELSKYNTTYDKDLGKLILSENSDKIHFSRLLLSKNNKSLSNETIYSFRWLKDKEGNILDKGNIINKIDLLKESVDYLNKIFKYDEIDEDKINKLLCLKEKNRKIYNQLKIIYNENYIDNKTNPFYKYMESKLGTKNNFRWIDINCQKIRCLKIIGDPKTDDNIIILKNHSNNAIMESLKSLSIRIYKNNKEKYITIPINQKVLNYDNKTRKLKIDKHKLNLLLEKNNIKNKKYIEIKDGSIFLRKNSFKNDLYYANGSGQFKDNKIEIKSLITTNKNIWKNSKSGQKNISISTIINEYYLVDVDDLGYLYNIREIKI